MSLLSRVPLDVIFLILRLIPIKDALLLLQTSKFFYFVTEYRPFWVYANMDADFLQRRPGREGFDYSQFDLDDLKSRLVQSHRVFNARTHTVNLGNDIRLLLAVPWSRLLVLLEGHSVFLRDWNTGATSLVPVHRSDQVIVGVKLFWEQSLTRNVLVVHLAKGFRGPDFSVELQLFAINTEALSAVHLATIEIPHAVTAFAMILITSDARPTIISHKVARFYPQGILSASSLAILDGSHVMLANPAGMAVYCLEDLQDSEDVDRVKFRHIRSCWQHLHLTSDVMSRPPLGPLLIDPSTGEMSQSICGGNFIRTLYVAPGKPYRFRLSKTMLIDRLPVYLGIAAGTRIGVYRRPYSSPTFTTFPLSSGGSDMHPFSSRPECLRRVKGSIFYRCSLQDMLEPGSLAVDEGEGRIMFMLHSRSNPRRPTRAVIIELV
ncbi:hypothetical protein C8R43DRAFT_949960 [Mycena crocata]|nr:hypothetical protein C8R43DRAFT_949960 [Mycena crocata]